VQASYRSPARRARRARARRRPARRRGVAAEARRAAAQRTAALCHERSASVRRFGPPKRRNHPQLNASAAAACAASAGAGRGSAPASQRRAAMRDGAAPTSAAARSMPAAMTALRSDTAPRSARREADATSSARSLRGALLARGSGRCALGTPLSAPFPARRSRRTPSLARTRRPGAVTSAMPATAAIATVAVVGLAAAWPALWWLQVRALEKPAFTVLRTLGPRSEVRAYAPYIIAEAEVPDERTGGVCPRCACRGRLRVLSSAAAALTRAARGSVVAGLAARGSPSPLLLVTSSCLRYARPSRRQDAQRHERGLPFCRCVPTTLQGSLLALGHLGDVAFIDTKDGGLLTLANSRLHLRR
jgi:hypothetical protein